MTSKVEMVTVVIPTLNESGNIIGVINTIKKVLKYPYEIIIVDGGSNDGTLDIVTQKKCKLIIEPRRGYGLALRLGMKQAKGNILVMVDGDGTYEVGHINLLLDTLMRNNAELCQATRMYDLRKAMGFTNFVANKIITFCFDFFYGQFLSDTQSGFRAISRSALEKVELYEDDMAFATEMLVQFAKKNLAAKAKERPDLVRKVETAMEVTEGLAYVHIYNPCVTGWGIEEAKSIEVCRLSVKSRYFPLYEARYRNLRITHKIKRPIPVSEYLSGIGKFSHLTAEQIDEVQETVDRRYRFLEAIEAISD